jgi:hypothetical protein
MGFMGLDNWVCSDNAADLMGKVLDSLGKILLEHVDKRDNEYNTQGWMDVALVVEELLVNNKHIWPHISDDLYNALLATQINVELQLDNMNEESEFYKDFKRMNNNLSKILKVVKLANE